MDLTLREKTGGRRLVALLAAIMAAVALAFACLPVTAEALTVSNATARPNEDGGSSVIGGIATRLTWEATVDDGEEVSSITLQLPDDGTFNGSSTKVTVLEETSRSRAPIPMMQASSGLPHRLPSRRSRIRRSRQP